MKQKARVRSAVAFLLTLTLMLTGMVTNYAPLVQTVYAAEAQETVSEEADAQQGEVLTENTVDTKAETVAKDVEPETQLKAEAEAVEEAEAETAEVKASEAGEVETAEAKADAGAAEVKASETGEVKEAEVETAEAKADAAEVETAEAKADADATEGEEAETADVEEADAETGEVQPEESAVRTEDGAQQTTVAEWSYSALPENTETIAATSGSGTLTCAGAIVDSYTSSGLTAKPWVYDVAAASGWVMDVDAANSSDLRFTAELRSSGTGPAQFQLMYCLDGQTGWTPIAGTEITLKSTNKEKVYDGLTLPAELNGSHFKLGVLLMGDASVNAFVKNDETLKIAPTGTSSINHIIITGTADGTTGGGEAGGEEPGGEEEPKPQICAKVTADAAPGEVISGTKVTLSCKTEGAVITYNTDGSESYKPYTEAITITENTTIYAVADKEGYAQSEKAVFAYTIKEEVPEVTKDAKRMDHLTDGNVVALYYGKDGLALSTEANGTKLKGAAASLSGDVLKVPAAAAELTVVADAEGNYSFLSDGKYLTSGATGSKLSFETEASEYSLWKLEKADDNGGFYVVNANAKYGTSPQYMEYYSGFTTYSYKADSDAIYVYNFYLLEEGTRFRTRCTAGGS